MSDTTQPASAPAPQTAPPSRKISIVYRDADPPVVTWRGQQFIKDQPREFDESLPLDFDLIEAARGNPSFDVGGESKAEMRAAEEKAAVILAAQAELATIDAEGATIEARQTQETNDLEAKHQAERDAWLDGKETRAIHLREVIRGSDGSDNLHHVDEPKPPSDGSETSSAPVSVPAEPAPPEPSDKNTAAGPVAAEPNV